MKKLLVLLGSIFLCHAKVTPPPLHVTSFDHAIKQDLINRLDNAGHENDAIKNFTHFFVTNPEYIDQLSLLDLQDFITFVKFRWDSSYCSAPLLLCMNSYFGKDDKLSEYEQKLHERFAECREEYDTFRKAAYQKDVRAINEYIKRGLPYDEIVIDVLLHDNRDLEIIALIENAGADKDIIKNLRKYVNFYLCIKHNNIEYIEKAIGFNCQLNEVPWYLDHTALMTAVLQPTSDYKTFKCLLDHGASINEPCNGMGQTVLHIAARWSNPETIEWLIMHGANIDVQDSKGHIPLFYAYPEKNFKMLLSYNPDLAARDNRGQTLMEWIYSYHQYDREAIRKDPYVCMLKEKINSYL